MTEYGFYVNTDICVGCKACMTACMDRQDLTAPIKYRKVWEFGGGGWRQDANGAYTNNVFSYYASLTCNQCEDPACVANCPVGAMTKDATTGIVSCDSSLCIGCEMCRMSCPYSHPTIFADSDGGKKYSHKCLLCTEESKDGTPEPVCANACPVRALEFGKLSDLQAKYGTANTIGTLGATTQPNVVIKPHRQAGQGGQIMNPEELSSWLPDGFVAPVEDYETFVK
jgi:anaerobic dimethyl sulfoxide reductase subunit B (iron-sulfur subunit)